MSLRERVVLACLLVFAPTIRADETAARIDRELTAAGIPPTASDVVAYLRAMRPTEDRSRRTRADLAALGSSDFEERRAATLSLLRTPRLPRESLESLRNDSDPEVRVRASRILQKSNLASQRSKLIALLMWIEREQPEGVCPLLLALIDDWIDDTYVRDLFSQAVVATARPEDEADLHVHLESGTRERRIAALNGLAAIGDEGELRRRLGDEDPAMRLAAVLGLLNAGRRDVLPALVDLLEADELDVRSRAARSLRFTTDRRFAYAAYDPAEQRVNTVRVWRAWLESDGGATKLRLPIVHRQHQAIGRTLIGLHNERKLREIDAQGNVLWEAGGFTYLWGCHALPDGRRLAVDYSGKFLVEFDATGKKSWLVDDLPGKPTSVERLDDGNTLVALAEPGLIVEISPEKEIVWKCAIEGRPTTAQRLDNGRTLVCLQFGRRVAEIDTAGTVRWEIKGLRRPHTAQRLDNGNTLVCEMDPNGRVVEFDPAGNVIWEVADLDNPAQAQRLSDGRTMVSSDDGVTVYDRRGEAVDTIKVSRSRFFAY